MKPVFKYVAVGLLLALGAGVAGVAHRSGRVVGSGLVERSTGIAAAFPRIQVLENRLEPGWWTSKHHLSLAFGCEADTPETNRPRLALVSSIHHGPFPAAAGFGMARIDTQVMWPEAVQRRLDELGVPQNKLPFRTEIDFAGRFETEVRSDALTHLEPQTAAQLKWAGGRLQVSGDSSLGFKAPFGFQFEMNGLQAHFPDAKARAELGAVSLRGSFGGSETGLIAHSAARMEAHVDQFKLQLTEIDGPLPVSMELLQGPWHLESEQTVQQGLTQVHNRHQLSLQDRGRTVGKLEADVRYENLQLATFEQVLRDAAIHWLQCPGEGAASPTENMGPEAFNKRWRAGIDEFLAATPAYSLDRLHVRLGEHQAEFSSRVEAQGLTFDELDRGNADWLRKVDASAQARLDTGWVRELIQLASRAFASEKYSEHTLTSLGMTAFHMMSEQAVKEGRMLRRPDGYSVTWTLKQGVSSLNGQVSDLADWRDSSREENAEPPPEGEPRE